MRLLAVLFLLLLFHCGKPAETVDIERNKQEVRYVTAVAGLNMRMKPSATATPTTLLAFGSAVKVLSESAVSETFQGVPGKWVEVEYNGQKGWAFGGFLSAEKPKASRVIGKWVRLDDPEDTLRFSPDGSFQRNIGPSDAFAGSFTESGDRLTVSGRHSSVFNNQTDQTTIDFRIESANRICHINDATFCFSRQ